MSRTLVLVRHGQSEWNLKNLFTGWRDVDLTEQGVGEAKGAGQRIKALKASRFGHVAFTSDAAARAEDLRSFSRRLGQTAQDHCPRPGAERARLWRSVRPQQGRRPQEVGRGAGARLAPLLCHRSRPGGESLKRPPARASGPITSTRIQPHVLRGETVLVAAHGNSLRALIMALDGLTG
jgi:2,3-bisphosphoglycerate-dependent phosphoglycerate mutase